MKTNEFTYKVMDLNTAQLEIPRENYQRELSPDRVRRIVKAFDERIANEPKVSYRGGHYYVFDGQHTIAARKLRNDNQDLKVRCKVYFGIRRSWQQFRKPRKRSGRFGTLTHCSSRLRFAKMNA